MWKLNHILEGRNIRVSSKPRFYTFFAFIALTVMILSTVLVCSTLGVRHAPYNGYHANTTFNA